MALNLSPHPCDRCDPWLYWFGCAGSHASRTLWAEFDKKAASVRKSSSKFPIYFFRCGSLWFVPIRCGADRAVLSVSLAGALKKPGVKGGCRKYVATTMALKFNPQ